MWEPSTNHGLKPVGTTSTRFQWCTALSQSTPGYRFGCLHEAVWSEGAQPRPGNHIILILQEKEITRAPGASDCFCEVLVSNLRSF